MVAIDRLAGSGAVVVKVPRTRSPAASVWQVPSKGPQGGVKLVTLVYTGEVKR
ncbi:hypothetical protein [Paenacidovorax monticola]|uniref:Uncharacterized protein n=1 Tax=Paenacidovorax monticola TaxID=1926868 RepID=A0A7H0HDX5_9BURK|nr:hypothetical protein [Paenacidovorax monticola]QNP58741.1 hypothetical protein H9L24_17545 [Paenacidovorax monticola]